MNRNHYLAVAVGDLVLIQFEGKNKELRITEIERRYGKSRNGTRKQNPLIIGVNLETSKKEHFDAGFVTKILGRREGKTVHPKKNHFQLESPLGSFEQRGNRWIGTLTALVVHALGKLPYELDRPLHEGRVRRLYEKSALGKKLRNEDQYYEEVDGRLFMRWVAKNYTRLIMSSKEYHAYQTRQIIQGERQTVADMERWMEMDEESWLFSK